QLPKQIQVVRAMPNLPALIGKGMTGLYAGKADPSVAETIFSTIGKVAVFEKEADIDAVAALSASGAGFLFLIIDALADGGVKLGLSREKAILLAAQTVFGSGAMVLDTGEHPAVLRDLVTSPAGTTIAGIDVLERAGVRGALIAALEAAAHRAAEIGRK